jgi:spore coat protein JB
MTGKDGLMRSITEVSFTLDELRLFLDTHPDCEEMLSVFRAKEEERAGLVGKYTEKYGDIEGYYPETKNGWSWNAAPMPWKKEADN